MSADDLPPLPSYTLTPRPPLLPPIPDKFLILILPILAYWSLSMFFHWIDEYDLFPQYRLHTPVEVLKRNRASRWQVLRDVIVQQVVQTLSGAAVAYFEPEDSIGMEEYHLGVWAQRLRIAQRVIPNILSLVGLDAIRLGKNLGASHPMLAGPFLGGRYPTLQSLAAVSEGQSAIFRAYAPWEMFLAKSIYFVGVPLVQFAVAIIVVDTWQYFLHRAMHMNKWLYNKIHSRHHRLYVPYAYGALYNHPFEGFLLDTLGAGIAYKIAGLTTRQGMWFFAGSTFKTVDDHCGYALPWDPLQHLTSNNAGYHDVHHQSWGIKTNFSQPFFTFWDKLLGTEWTGGDISVRYEKSRLAAQKALDKDTSVTGSNPQKSQTEDPNPYENELTNAKIQAHVPVQPHPIPGKSELQAAGSRQQVLEDTSRAGGPDVLVKESAEERGARRSPRKSPRKSKANSLSASMLGGKGMSSACVGGLGS